MIDGNVSTDQDRVTKRHRLVAVLLFVCLIVAAPVIGAIYPFDSSRGVIEAAVTPTEARSPDFTARNRSGEHVLYGMTTDKPESNED